MYSVLPLQCAAFLVEDIIAHAGVTMKNVTGKKCDVRYSKVDS